MIRRGTPLRLAAITLTVALSGCSQARDVGPGDLPPFCSKARAFEALGIPDSTKAPVGAGPLRSLKALYRLAPDQLRPELRALIGSQQANQPRSGAEQRRIRRIGLRVGRELEQACGVQLPGVR